MTSKDKIVFNFNGDMLALDLEAIDSIVEVEHISLIPYSPVFLNGIISLHGEVITVIDIPVLFETTWESQEPPYKVVISKMNGTYMGFYIGKARISFLWNERIGKMKLRKEKEKYIIGVIESDDTVIKIIDWDFLLKLTTEALSKGYQLF
ncbi:MAG: chemotaxis protein CheW [Thermodesulfobacteriota bacterium]